MAYDDLRGPSPASSACLADSPAWLALTPAQIASWSLTPDLPDTSSTFIDVLELTDEDLRWLRERPRDPAFVLDAPEVDAPAHIAPADVAAIPVAGDATTVNALACGSAPASSATEGSAVGDPAPLAALPVGQPFWATPGVTPPSVPDVVSPRLAAAQEAIGALLARGALSGSRADTEALLRLAEQARAAALVELAEMDATGGHQAGDLRGTTTATWLRDTLRLSDPVARATVRLAVQLRDELPALRDAVTGGSITVEHARAALDGVRGLDPDVVRDAADGILGLAALVDPPSLRRTLRDKAIAVDPRLAEEAARRAEARQGIRVSEVGDHTAIDGTLAGEQGELLRRALILCSEKARVDGDTRSQAARNADVFLGWAVDALHREHGPGDSLREDAHTVRTHVHVIITPDQLAAAAAQINREDHTGSPDHSGGVGPPDGAGRAGGTCHRPGGLAALLDADPLGQHTPAAPLLLGATSPLTLGALRRLTCDATVHLTVQRDLRAGDTGHACDQQPPGTRLGTPPPPGWVCSHLRDPLYVGRSSRTVTGAIFKALVLRDRHCVVKGCHRPPAACEAHHVQWWANGGGTHLGNLVLLCHAHHHDLHDRAQQLPHHDSIRWITETGWASDPP